MVALLGQRLQFTTPCDLQASIHESALLKMVTFDSNLPRKQIVGCGDYKKVRRSPGAPQLVLDRSPLGKLITAEPTLFTYIGSPMVFSRLNQLGRSRNRSCGHCVMPGRFPAPSITKRNFHELGPFGVTCPVIATRMTPALISIAGRGIEKNRSGQGLCTCCPRAPG